MVLDLCQTCSFGLIDSFPCALCHSIRNMSAIFLSEVADFCYNATKKTHYYSLKFSVLVSDSGFPIDYVVTPAPIYDGDVALELLENSIVHFQSFMEKNDMLINKQRQRWQTVVSC
ncbi:TPA: hypothetical protein ACGO1M_001398 [Streptococcus suis]